jgi:peptidoglycan/LPS O-acetylase OafA/YrhL
MQQKVFFPPLDGMRFFAFFFVFMFHCYYGIPEQVSGNRVYLALNRFWENGDLGVNFFFTLSGFLITYLLMREEQDTGYIHIKNFYLRRILRIWPLYYFTFLFGYFIFQALIRLVGAGVMETANPWYYIFFLGNFNSIVNGDPLSGTLSVLWSIAIEEQYYLCWPLLLVAFRKNRQFLFWGIMAISLAFRAIYVHNKDVLFYHSLSVMSDLAIGSWLGWWCFTKNVAQKSLHFRSRLYPIAIYAIGFALLFFRKEIFVHPALVMAERLIYALFFGFIIFEQCYFSNSFYKMEKFRLAGYWGKYTYALYCLHIPAMVFTEGFAMMAGAATSPWWLLWGKTVSTLLLSLAFSKLSYRFIERPFLRLKTSFEAQQGVLPAR